MSRDRRFSEWLHPARSGPLPASGILLLPLLFLISVSPVPPASAQQASARQAPEPATAQPLDLSRMVSIGSAVTETIFELGAGENLVAVDESSIYPAGAAALPKVAFTRTLSAEGILSMAPSVVLASGAAGPESTLRQIRSAGVSLVLLNAEETVEGAFARVEQLGEMLGRRTEASALMERMQRELAAAEAIRSELSTRPTVLFIYARGPNILMAAGRGTSAKTMIELAGGRNAFDSFSGYKPLTAEAVVSVNPDVILMMDSGVESLGGEAGVLHAPGVRLTNAAENRRIHSMEGNYLLGFGPRMGRAVMDLMGILHPETKIVR